jgi:hypothetical protein
MSDISFSGNESISFALLCSVTNFAGMCSESSGAWLFPRIGLSALIIISSITSFLCLFLIKYLTFKPHVQEERSI